MILWSLNSVISWYSWSIFIHAHLMPILFYGLAGSRCPGLSAAELRGWKRMTNLQTVFACLFAVSYSIKTNIYNSAPSWHSQPRCKRPRINTSAWDRSSWQQLRQIVFSSSGWKLKFPNLVKLAYCCICRWEKKTNQTNENILTIRFWNDTKFLICQWKNNAPLNSHTFLIAFSGARYLFLNRDMYFILIKEKREHFIEFMKLLTKPKNPIFLSL